MLLQEIGWLFLKEKNKDTVSISPQKYAFIWSSSTHVDVYWYEVRNNDSEIAINPSSKIKPTTNYLKMKQWAI